MTEEELTAQTGEVAGEVAAAGDETSGAAGQDPQDRIAELERRVAELERQVATERDAATDYMNRWQRAQADFSNYKRRAQQDQAQLQRTFAAEAARIALPALDSFERAFATLPQSLRGLTWIEGIALVEMQLRGMLNVAGVRPVAAEPGHAFDPAKHEAIGEVETTEHPAGNVAVVVQPGYEVDGLLLRPALVQIARAPAPSAGTNETTPDVSSSPETAAETPETPVAAAAGAATDATATATTATTPTTAEMTTIEAETATQDTPAS